MQEDYANQIGFDIGWDFARFGRVLVHSASDRAIHEGYLAGREHFQVPQHIENRFSAKWLQLRLNAYKRRRILSPEVTPDYIKRIDCDICPITLVRLTHSTLLDSDWSVDRINNDGAYAAGNLMVVSTKANRAKGAKRLDEVVQLASHPPLRSIQGLIGREWARMSSIMVGADNSSNRSLFLGPLLTRIPEDARVPLYFLIQQIILMSVPRAAARNQLIRSLNRLHPLQDRHLALNCAAERLSRLVKCVPYQYDALADEKVQSLLRGWFTTLTPAATQALIHFCATYGGTREEPNLPKTWSLATHGRF